MVDEIGLKILGSLNENSSMHPWAIIRAVYGVYRQGSYPGMIRRLNNMGDSGLVRDLGHGREFEITSEARDKYFGKK